MRLKNPIITEIAVLTTEKLMTVAFARGEGQQWYSEFWLASRSAPLGPTFHTLKRMVAAGI